MKTLKVIDVVSADQQWLPQIAEHIAEYLHNSAVLFSYGEFDAARTLHSIVGITKLVACKCVESSTGGYREQFDRLYQAFTQCNEMTPLEHIVLVLSPKNFRSFVPYFAARMDVPVLDTFSEQAVIVRIKRNDKARIILTDDLVQFTVSAKED